MAVGDAHSAAREIVEAADRRVPHLTLAVDFRTAYALGRDAALAHIYRSADLILAGGRLSAALAGPALARAVPTPETLLSALMTVAATTRLPMFLLAADAGVLGRAGAMLTGDGPGAAGMSHVAIAGTAAVGHHDAGSEVRAIDALLGSGAAVGIISLERMCAVRIATCARDRGFAGALIAVGPILETLVGVGLRGAKPRAHAPGTLAA